MLDPASKYSEKIIELSLPFFPLQGENGYSEEQEEWELDFTENGSSRFTSVESALIYFVQCDCACK